MILLDLSAHRSFPA